MNYLRHHLFYLPLAFLVLALLLYGLNWKVQADMLSARLDRANGGEIMPGVVFAFAGKSVGGFPFTLDVTLDGVTFAHEGPGGETAWRAEKIAIHALSTGAGPYVLDAAGLQSFAEPGENGGPPRVLYVTPRRAHANAIMVRGELTRLDLDLSQLEGKDASLGAAADRTFSAGRAQFHLASNADKTISIALTIENGAIGSGYHPQLGSDPVFVTATGRIAEAQAFDAMRKGAQSPLAAIQAWREAHGRIPVDSFRLRWNGVSIEAAGELQPAPRDDLIGGLQGKLTGLKAFARAMTRNQTPAAQAQAVRLVDSLPVKEPVGANVSLRAGQVHFSVDLLPKLVGTL